ncbi:UNVERIFIED_CONTAM: Piezo-type mechanosensitive ion channel, partial [Sesamum angustifolium]
SGVRHTNILLRGPVFRIFSINWFTYGFPISLFALSYWSFHFASICAFGLLAYVGYILYAFPSLFRLHRLNGLLLVFILLWAVSTYVFNVAFAYTKLKAGKDMEIWEMVGLWHYPIPGFFLLAQFCLGILVALGNLVNNSVFLCLSNEERRLSSENETEEVKEDAKVLIVATIAWGLRKCSRAIMLLLIFLIATKPGFIHAAYMIFFFAYLLSHKHTACPPIGFSILRAGLSKSVLLSVYATSNIRENSASCSHERRIALYLNAIGKVLSTYRSFGTYIAFLTILIAVYLVRPNYISFGYIFLLLVWIIGRQLDEKTKDVYGFHSNYERRQSEHLKSQDPDPLQLGIPVYRPSFEGLEAGLRPKVLVVVACTLQYNVFRWLKMIPSSLLNIDGSEEPCPLFVSAEDLSHLVSISDQDNPSLSGSRELSSQMMEQRNSWSYLRPHIYQQSEGSSSHRGACDGSNRKYDYIWGTMTESYKWKKKRIVALRQERFEMQKTTLRVYLKFWMENMFNLFGLEINMIALLLASFALLNAISMVYIACLAICILLPRPTIRKLWPIFAFLFATVLLAEYFAMWKSMMPLNRQLAIESNARCNDCWKNSNIYFYYCEKCWLGLVVDDPRMLISYYVVFMLTCFKLRADHASGFSWSFTYEQMVSQRKNAFVWRDLSFETKSMWTFLDYLRVYCYCHLLDLVLALILITGTLEYDVLHFGYLGFALIFFRMRLTILKKKNKIFKYLRIYNFAVIVLSLAYQSPFLSYMFSSSEFNYVFRYLEAEQIGAIVQEQEKKAAWKTEQLQHIRKSEENKSQRNLQVEKMKSEMLNLQIQLHGMNSTTAYGNESPTNGGVRRRRNASLTMQDFGNFEKRDGSIDPDQVKIAELEEHAGDNAVNDSDKSKKVKSQSIENSLASAVQLLAVLKHWKSLTQEAESPPTLFNCPWMSTMPKDGFNREGIWKISFCSLCMMKTECEPAEQYNSLTPAADVAKEILKARSMGLAEKLDFHTL